MRLFFAVDMPKDPSFEQLNIALKKTSKHLKPVDPDRQHITLKFLGDPEVGSEDVIGSVKDIGSLHSSFEMKVEQAGAFPNWRKPSVLWLGLSPSDELRSLAKDIDLCLHDRIGTGIEKREFRAHITIARFKGRETFDTIPAKDWMEKAVRDLENNNYTIPVNEFYLINSTLTPKGPIYRKISSFPLDG
jgi:RNA 2',3'-cyclic 3'-phosphodiesterase